MKTITKGALGLSLGLLLAGFVGAQDNSDPFADLESELFGPSAPEQSSEEANSNDSTSSFEDDMFGGSDDDFFASELVSDDEEDQSANIFLSDEPISFGGSFDSSISFGRFTADNPEKFADLWDDETSTELFNAPVSANLTFNARPSNDFRFFTEVDLGIPLVETFSVLGSQTDLANNEADTASIGVPNLEIGQLFADFNWERKLFFKVGKQNVSWGTGFFFSPADILNLEPIDPLDPEASREGPVAIKVDLPIDVNNMRAFLIAPDGIDSAEDLKVAAQGQVYLGNHVLSLGATYQKEESFGAALTWSGPIGQIDGFAEATIQHSSQGPRIILDESIDVLGAKIAEDDESWFPQFTIGALYSNDDISISGQYLFTSFGYADPEASLGKLDVFQANPLLAAEYLPLIPSVLVRDLGQHYAAVNLSFPDIGESKLSTSLFAQANLSDLSGLTQLSVSYRFFDYFSVNGRVGYTFGAEDEDEFVLKAAAGLGRLSYALTFNLGGRAF